MVDKVIAIIPARGNSKRLPNKNIIDFFGKPLISWTIEAAIECGCFAKILVSTDHEAIAKIARKSGAEVPFMREQAADDFSPVSLATIAALRQAEAYWQTSFSHVVQLMANCPLRTKQDIIESLTHFKNANAEFQISCYKHGWMNPWLAVKINENSKPIHLFPEVFTKRSQDLESLYGPTGAIWIAKTEAFYKANTFYGPNYIFKPIKWTSAIDIDDEDDLLMARAIKLLQLESFTPNTNARKTLNVY